MRSMRGQRFLSLLLIISMLLSMFPGTALAADPVTVISTPEALAAYSNKSMSGNFQLGADLDMSETEMKPISSLSGSFDGGGHTISNLTVTGNNAGLFGQINSGSEVSNLILKDCDVTSTGTYSSAGTLAGKIYSSATIANCGVEGGSVEAPASSYAGGLIGQASYANTVEVANCYSSAAVSGPYRTGGLIGAVSGTNFTLENCYATGDVTASGGYAGGLIGYVSCTGSYALDAENCYAAGTVTGGTSYGFTYVYGNTGAFTNCYYDSNNSTAQPEDDKYAGVTGLATPDLQAAAATLGGAFQQDSEGLNNGYPILKWQDPNATYQIVLTVEPQNAEVELTSATEGTPLTADSAVDGVYTYSGLASGSAYNYTVSQSAGAATDYAPASGVITIGKADVARTITLQPNRYDMTFTLTPAEAVLEVKDSAGEPLSPTEEAGLTYSVTNGSYTYNAQAFGYKTLEDSVVIDKAGQEVAIVLEEQASQQVTFVFDPAGQDIQNRSLTVTAQLEEGAKTMTPDEDGGLTYTLPVGYRYQYVFRASNYAKQTGEIDLTAAAGGAQQQQTISLAPKTAWEGADDIETPSQEAEVYQIANGAQLAWLAQEVNAGRGGNYQAVLTADIDLGGEEWTPIGTLSNPFKGSFDGQGYTVKNLSILSPTSDNLGLFGSVNGGTVRNLTVAGSIQTSKSSVGGITGIFTGTGSLLENCVNQVDVEGSMYVGGLVGKVDGNQAKTIQNCVNQGDISANNAAGGLVGYFYYKGDLINCYNTGNVTATTSKAGGLVGHMSDSNAKVTNCYTIGTVTGGSSIQAGIGSKSSGAVANCYALEGLPADANVTFQTAAYMKSAAFLDDLGEAFQADVSGSVNNGYPIFSFQDDTVYYTAAITVNDAAAKVTLQGQDGTPFTPVSSEDGVFTYQLPAGVYTYSVSAFGKVSQTGLTLTVVDQAVAASVTLEQAPAYQTDFQITYADGNPNSVTPAIQVKWEGRVIEAQAGGGYLLPDGDYTYSISATGYSKEQGSFTIAGQAQTIEKELTVYTGWDGVSTAKPEGDGTAAQPYQISTAEELAWFAGLVNGTLTDGSAQNTGAYGVLTEDIHLYEKEWTPIGTGISSLSYTGVFDGGNHTVSGLKVTDNGNGSYGFFGSLKGATVQNVTVQGQVTADVTFTSGAIGGLAGTATGGSQILNCGNQADVTSNYGATGGILGSATSANGATISRCYNTGTISYTGSSNAGGILGQQNDAITITDCYNTGAVTSSGNGNRTSGIAGNLGYSSKVINCYNTGTISANSSKQYAITYTSGVTLTNCHYLEGLTVADAAASTAQSQTTMTSEAFPAVLGENWKTDGIGQNSINQGYPVLQWQTVVPGGEEPGTQLATPYAQWQHGYTEEGQAYVTLHAVWQGIDHASSYTIQLYNWAGDVLATVTGITTDDSSYDKATNTFTYDLEPTLQQAATEAGVNDAYQFTVTAVGDGTVYVDSQESLKAGPVEYVVTKIGSPLAGAWQGEDLPIARWDYTDFAAYYTVNLYKDGVLNTSVSTAYTYFDFSAYIRAAGDYTFTVVACPANGEAYNSDPSGLSNVFHYDATPEEPEEGEWVTISTPQEFLALATVKNESTGEVDEDNNPINQQTVAWSKNYKLAKDIDLSALSAEEVAKGMAIGNREHPFTGIFDGNGFTISGLTLSNGDCGLFNYIGQTGLVRNLTIENANVLYADNAGVLAVTNFGTIKNCAVINSNITADSGAIIGGFISRNYGTIQQSYVLGGALVANSSTANGHAGFAGGNYGTIQECYTSMDVQSGSHSAGGFIGWSDNGGSCEDCFALGDVSAVYGWSGGFVGRINDSNSSFRNCYAFNTVSSAQKPDHVYGFAGGLGSEVFEDLWEDYESVFNPEYPAGAFATCYYSSTLMPQDNAKTQATAKTSDEMKTQAMATLLGAKWSWDQEKNDGLPYLNAVMPPESLPVQQLTVQLAIGTYDKTAYTFGQLGSTISVSLEGTGNTRVIDVLDAAVDQGLLTYTYASTPSFGRYIDSINGYTVEQPDGWMFTINDVLSNVSASLAAVKDGDRILWYEGTTENRFQGPTWQQLTEGSAVEWQDIASIQDLQALANATDEETLGKSYRLTTDLDLTGVTLSPIGSAAAPFTGVFDGQNHTISNLTLQGQANTGLFGVIEGATVKNLNVTNAAVTGTEQVGILVGYAKAELNKADMGQSKANLIGNCHVSGTITGNAKVGGLVGVNEGKYDSETLFSIYSAVDQCTADVTVTAAGADSANIGGLAGVNDGYITESSATGNVTAESAYSVGGLAGSNGAGIYDSFATGDVTGRLTVGGLVGSSGSDSIIKNCYSLGNVSGTDANIGGLVGSASGKIEHSLSAGTVTPGSGLTGYNGGLVGSFSGTLAGMDNQVTLKDSYGNCIAQDGSILNALGNGNSVQFPGDGNAAAMAAMQLTAKQDVSDKLYEMFGVNLDVPASLLEEVEKYKTLVSVANDTATGSAISLLKDGETANPDVTVAITVTSDYLAGGNALTLKQQNSANTTLTETITVSFTDPAGNRYYQTITVVLQAAGNALDNVMDLIAASYTESSDDWTVFDMAAYQKLAGKTSATSQDAYQNTLNLAITQIAGEAAVGDRARYEIVLRAMGIDTTKLYQVNSNTPIDNAKALASQSFADITVFNYYSAPWILLADLQGNTGLSQEQQQYLLSVLQQAMGEDGLFSYEWDGVTYTSPDTAGTMLSVLAPYYVTDTQAKAMADTILQSLSQVQGSNGSYGNANADAMVIIGLVAMGIDPASDSRFIKNGCTILDGMLTYWNEDSVSFQFMGQDNALATEQAFRALIAFSQFQAAGNTPYNIYDFSQTEVVPGRATGTGEVEKPSNPPAGNPDIKVTFTLKTDSQTWIPKHVLTVKEGSTVYHAFVQALDSRGLTYEGAERGYVTSITKDDVTLSEFDKGANSGWLYKVNGVVPTIGLTSYQLEDGDDIVWYYTTDWTKDSGASSNIGSNSQQDSKNPVLTPEATLEGSAATVEVNSTALKQAAETASKQQSSFVVIQPTGTEKADQITIELAKAALQEVADHSNAGLAIETELADLSLSNPGLDDLVAGSGSTVRITIAKQEDSSVQLDITLDRQAVGQLSGGLQVGLPGVTGQVAVLLDGEGEQTIIPKSYVEDGVAYLLLTDSSATVKVIDNSKSFQDVASNAWFYQAVNFAVSHQLFQGTTETSFEPNAPMTRAMLVTVLYRLEGEPQVTAQASFRDVPQNAWYSQAVTWAGQQGIVQGIDETTFAPDQNISRQELVTILHRYSQTIGLDVSETTSLSSFPDSGQIAGWAKEAAAWAVAVQILNGDQDGNFAPAGEASRAEVATMLQRLVAWMVK